jgi:hypothetical protein
MVGVGGQPNPNQLESSGQISQPPMMPMGTSPVPHPYQSLGYFTGFPEPIMFNAPKAQRSRRKSAPGLDHIKHRRTRSGCYTCRSRRVKVLFRELITTRALSDLIAVRRNPSHLRTYVARPPNVSRSDSPANHAQVVGRERENASTPNRRRQRVPGAVAPKTQLGQVSRRAQPPPVGTTTRRPSKTQGWIRLWMRTKMSPRARHHRRRRRIFLSEDPVPPPRSVASAS